ncbi:hypothetical protein ACWGCW_38480 [Streptomyces sp. NPDC054933]
MRESVAIDPERCIAWQEAHCGVRPAGAMTAEVGHARRQPAR